MPWSDTMTCSSLTTSSWRNSESSAKTILSRQSIEEFMETHNLWKACVTSNTQTHQTLKWGSNKEDQMNEETSAEGKQLNL